MKNLALANLWHRKLRSSLAALAVAIGVAMLVVMLALSHGTLGEVAQRVQSVQADLIMLPAKSSLIFSDGSPLSDKFVPKLTEVTVDGKPLVRRVIRVNLSLIAKMGGQQQRVFAVDPDDFDAFCGSREIVAGQVFPAARKFKHFIAELRRQRGNSYDADEVPEAELAAAAQMVIDDRLARAGGYSVGDKVDFLGRQFTICAIVEPGLAGRVFIPLQVLRHIQQIGPYSSLFFIQLNDELVTQLDETPTTAASKMTSAQAAELLRDVTYQRIDPLENYDQMLFDSFRSVYTYINIVSGIVLFVSFLFIMVTMYTMVLERRREIGILRSLGAGGWYIMGQTILEALTISLVGTAAGIGLAGGGKWLIEHYRPLLTVDIQARWIGLAIIVGTVGGLVSALYPGYRALRADPVECLTYE